MKKIERNFNLSLYEKLKECDWANPIIVKNDSENLEIISIDHSVDSNYPILMSDGERYSLNGKNKLNSIIKIYHDRKCPIIDGRIVSSKTFALRLLNFLRRTIVCDCPGEEELEYLTSVAQDLLDWQVETATSKEEIEYLEYNNIIKKETT